MFSFIPTPYNWIAAAVLVVGLVVGGAAAGGYVVHNADVVKLQAVQLAYSKAQTASVTASLNQLQGFIDKMNAAGTDYSGALAQINADFSAIKKEFANATLKPLPADCKPDADRLRSLSAAVAAANARSAPAK